MLSPAAKLAALLSLVICSLGCAQEREPISRVQADALEKRFFVEELANPDDDPEFFMRVSVVDVPAGAGTDGLFTNSDAQPTTRIRWEITEDLLLARLTYERIDGTDGKGVRRTPDGQVAAAYRIQSHFDVRRDYNPSTGEELNVRSKTRPIDRGTSALFRVSLVQPHALQLDTLSQLGIWYGVKWAGAVLRTIRTTRCAA
jgi:hypothetical protein